MRKIESDSEILLLLGPVENKTVIDVGCGTGNLVRTLSGMKADVTGIDTPEMLEKARKESPLSNETYVEGTAQELPFPDNSADIILYIASFHHVPGQLMEQALHETNRVLKENGMALFVEPIARDGSYYEVVRLVEDEREIQKQACETIQNASQFGLTIKSEEIVYLERSFNDYKKILEVFVDDENQRKKITGQAEEITRQFARKEGKSLGEFFYKSICRVIILAK